MKSKKVDSITTIPNISSKAAPKDLEDFGKSTKLFAKKPKQFTKAKSRVRITIKLKENFIKNISKLEDFMLLTEDKIKILVFLEASLKHSTIKLLRANFKIFITLLIIASLSSYIDPKCAIILLSVLFLLYAMRHKINQKIFESFYAYLKRNEHRLNSGEKGGLKLAKIEIFCDEYENDFGEVEAKVIVEKLALSRSKRRALTEKIKRRQRIPMLRAKSDVPRLTTEEARISDDDPEGDNWDGYFTLKSILKKKVDGGPVVKKVKKMVSFNPNEPQVHYYKDHGFRSSEDSNIPASPETRQVRSLREKRDKGGKFKIDMNRAEQSNLKPRIEKKETSDSELPGFKDDDQVVKNRAGKNAHDENVSSESDFQLHKFGKEHRDDMKNLFSSISMKFESEKTPTRSIIPKGGRSQPPVRIKGILDMVSGEDEEDKN